MDHHNAVRGALTVGGTGNVTFAATGSGQARPLSVLPTGWSGGIRFDDPNGIDWELSTCTALGSNVFSRDTLLHSSTGSKVNLAVGTIGLQTATAQQLNAFVSRASVTGTYAVGQTLTAAYPTGIVGTIQFTRTLAASPFTKTSISGAVASAVNSLTYTVQSADAGFNIGVDCSNQICTATGGLVPAGANIYARTQSALAAVSASTGYAKIGLLGDSTMAGAHGKSDGGLDRASSPVTFLKDKLIAAQSRPTIASNWVGDQRWDYTNQIKPYTFDARLTAPDGLTTSFFATQASPISVGGGMLKDNGNANRLGFLPEVPTDTTDVYYAVNTNIGSFTLTRNGGSAVTVTANAASSVGKTTYSSPLNSADPIYASRVSGGAYLIAMDSYNSAIKSIRLYGMGWSGGRAADWASTTTGFDPLNGLVALGLDLVVARFGTNDISVPGATTTSTDATAYQASINKILDALVAAGTNVILATHYPMNTTVMAQSVQDTYVGYVRSIAAARGMKLHDTYARLGTWAAANTAGKMYDNLHPNTSGYQDDAAALATLVLSLA